MTTTVEALYQDGKLILPQPLPLPDNARVRVIIETDAAVSDAERAAWLKLSEQRLTDTWDNADDDVFNELLAK